jgi:DNA-directed RNA polymerase specialized sigma24 family protein
MTDPKAAAPPDTLTAAEFEALLRRLDRGSERPGEKYEAIHSRLVRFFAWNSRSAAEDLADETLNRVARKLAAGRQEIHELEAFIWGVARKVQQEARKTDFKSVHVLDMPNAWAASDSGASLHAIHNKIQAEKVGKCLHECLSRWPDSDRELFLAYRVDKGHYVERRRDLAQKLGITPGALRVRIIRLREKLEKCVARCLGEATVSF